MPLKDRVGPELVALGRVVVDDVEDQLDPGIVQMRHHLLELGEGEVGVGRVAPGRGEETDRVVAPVVLQPLVGRWLSSTKVWTGSSSTVLTPSEPRYSGDLGAGQPGIGAAQRLGSAGWRLVSPRTCAS